MHFCTKDSVIKFLRVTVFMEGQKEYQDAENKKVFVFEENTNKKV